MGRQSVLCFLTVIFTLYMYNTYQPNVKSYTNFNNNQSQIIELQNHISILSFNIDALSQNLIQINELSKESNQKIVLLESNLEKTSIDLKVLRTKLEKK